MASQRKAGSPKHPVSSFGFKLFLKPYLSRSAYIYIPGGWYDPRIPLLAGRVATHAKE